MYDLAYFRERLIRNKWGDVIEDDKFFPDEEIMDNFPCFIHYAFAHLGLPALSTVQLEIVGFMEDKEDKHHHKLIQAGRGQGKSILSQCFVVWCLLNDLNEHILVVSAGSQRASNYTTFVKKLIGLLPITRPMYPRNNKERTSTTAFDVVGATVSDSPSIYATGIGGQITGMRATRIIFDDIETHLVVQSPALQERMIHSMNEAFNLLMSGHDKAIFLATPHSTNSVYIDLVDKGTFGFIVPSRYTDDEGVYNGCLAPFIVEDLKKDPSLVGKAIDERLNDEFLRSKELKIGKSNFKLQYMCDVSDSDELRYPLKLSDLIIDDVSDEDAPLKVGYSSMPDSIIYGVKHNGFKKDRLYKPLYSSEERTEYDRKILSIDPSGKGEDATGVAIIYMLNTRIFIKRLTNLDNGFDDENLSNVRRLIELHGIDTVVIEGNYGGGSYTKILEPYIPNGVVLEDITVKGQKEVRIIEVMEPLLNQHRIIVDKDCIDKDYHNRKSNSFTYQLTHITREKGCLLHDDILDAVCNGVSYLVDELSNNEDVAIDRFLEEEIEKTMEINDRIFNDFSSYSSFDNPTNYGDIY